MALYPAIPNSPIAKLTSAITAQDTSITVDDATKLPDAPNLATLGSDENNETILYTGKSGNTLTGVTRGFEGVAKSWDAESPIARLFTAYDYNTLIEKIDELGNKLGNIFSEMEEEFVVSEGQTLFTLTKGNYLVGNNRLTIYVNGIRQPDTSFDEISSTEFQLKQPIPSGSVILAVWYEILFTDKKIQNPPPAPIVTEINADRATVTGVSGTEVRLDSGIWYNSPHTFLGLSEATNYNAYARYKETDTHYASPQSAAANFNTLSSVPGPSTLIAGDMQAGYFGTISANDFITGDALCSAIGLSVGTSQYSTTDWLKFAYQGKILFVSQKPIRYNLSWDNINAVGAVYGSSTVTINGLTYKVRSFRGAEHDPTDSYTDPDRDAIGSEWNDLMLPIHANAATGSWAHPAYAGTVPDWDIGFTDADLLTHISYGNGSYTWCQEVNDTRMVDRVYRGYSGVSHLGSNTASYASANYSFRPVLELEES